MNWEELIGTIAIICFILMGLILIGLSLGLVAFLILWFFKSIGMI